MKINMKISLQQFLPLLETEIQGLLHPAQANLVFWFQFSSCPQHSLKALVLLNPTCLLKCILNCEQNFLFFIFRSGLSDIQINCNRISDGLL
jgi:hypothetical protein